MPVRAEKSVLRRGLRLVYDHVRLHPGPFIVAVFGAALFAACSVLSTVVIGRITDDVVLPAFESPETDSNALAWGAVAIIAVTILRATGVVLRRYYAGMTSERVQQTLRRRLADQYLELPMAWHQRTPAGRLLAHADNDAQIATELLHPLPFSLGVGFLVFFSAISLVLVDLVLAAVAFLIFPMLIVFNKIYTGRVEEPAARVQHGVGVVSSIAHESFDGALVVKTLGRSDAEIERFNEAAQRLRVERQTVGYIRAVFEPALDALPNLGIVLVLLVGLGRVEAGAVRPGELVQVAALFTVLAFPMRVLGFFLEMVPPSVVARERLTEVLDVEAPPGPTSVQPLPDGPLSLSLENVSYGFEQGQRLLHDISFDISPGETVALVGSTGSGKTTLASLAAGLVPPDAGAVRLGGVPVDHVLPSERTNAVALVFQESFLFADSLAANIDLEHEPDGAGSEDMAAIRAAAGIAKVDDFVSELPDGYRTEVGERGVTLSGGQRQRVALARALLRHPRLLILDDATSAVDARVEQQILQGLREELKMTTLVVAQRVSTIQLANRVVYLSHGRVEAVGTHEELLENPGYLALVTAYEAAAQ